MSNQLLPPDGAVSAVGELLVLVAAGGDVGLDRRRFLDRPVVFEHRGRPRREALDAAAKLLDDRLAGAEFDRLGEPHRLLGDLTLGDDVGLAGVGIAGIGVGGLAVGRRVGRLEGVGLDR